MRQQIESNQQGSSMQHCTDAQRCRQHPQSFSSLITV